MTTLRAGRATDVGRVREINEDRFLVDSDGALFAVADGVGGHQAGEVASQTSVEALKAAFVEMDTASLVRAVQHANDVVWHLAQSASEHRGMGTTLTAAALVRDSLTGEDRLAVVNVGDSRAYLLQHGEMLQVSEDHSLVEEMVRDGQITSEEALVHPRRSIITRALGMEPEIEVDSWELIPYAGDRLLLCSDGLTNELTVDRIAAILRQLADPDEAARELVAQARAAGGNDNITAVVIDVLDDGGRAKEASAVLARDRRPARAGSASNDAVANDAGIGSTSLLEPFSPQEPEARSSPAPSARPPVARRRRPRVRLSWRTGIFVILVVGIVIAAYATVGWYARSSWYVGLDAQGQVTVFKGRPGGLLWFEPTAEDTKLKLTIDQVQGNFQQDVREGKQFSSKVGADRYVNEVRIRPTPTTVVDPAPVNSIPVDPAAVPPTTIGPPP